MKGAPPGPAWVQSGSGPSRARTVPDLRRSCTKQRQCSTQVGCSRVTWVHDRCSFTGHGRVWANQPFSKCNTHHRQVEADQCCSYG